MTCLHTVYMHIYIHFIFTIVLTVSPKVNMRNGGTITDLNRRKV